MAALSTLVDPFSGASLGALWTAVGTSANQTVTEGSGVLNCKLDDSLVAPNNLYVRSASTYAISGSYIIAKLNSPFTTSDTGGKVETMLQVRNTTDDDGLAIQIASTSPSRQIQFQAWNSFGGAWQAGSSTPITYDPVNHAWLCIMEHNATFYFFTAPDSAGLPGTWTQQYSIAESACGNFGNLANFLTTANAELLTMFWSAPGVGSITGPAVWDSVNPAGAVAPSFAVGHSPLGLGVGVGLAF